MEELYINEKKQFEFGKNDVLLLQNNIILLDTTNDSKKIISHYHLNDKLKIINISKQQKNYKKIKKHNILFLINKDTNITQYKNILNILIKSNTHIGIQLENKTLLGFVTEKIDNTHYKNFIDGIIALQYKNLKKQYSYIYDTVCNQLDEEFQTRNICDFQNDMCIANRKGKTVHSTMGCCYSFKYSQNPLKFIENVELCKHIVNKSCDIKCIGCKLFVCDYLKKNGIQFNTKDILLLDAFFNNKQQETIQKNFFLPKEKIIDKLLQDKKNKLPYFLYYIRNKAIIR